MTRVKQFEVKKFDSVPKWRSSDIWVPIHPAGTPNYYGRPGDLMDYDGYNHWLSSTKDYLCANIPDEFYAELVPVGYSGGRSAANVRLQDQDRPYSYLLGVYDYFDALKKSSLPYGQINGDFKMTKKGSNYRIELVRQEV